MTSQRELERTGGGLLPTVADVLALPAVRYGRPEVHAGRDHLYRKVRWAHVSELPDIAGLLQGGELILTTGIALPGADADLRRYADTLAEADAAGLMVELGRRFTELPASLVAACDRHLLPLVAFHREVKFVKVTEAVHSLIAAEQFTVLRATVQAHDVFTSLCVEGAPAVEIVREASRLTGCPVIFENLMHQVLAYDAAGVPVDDLLRNWEARSRRAAVSSTTTAFSPEGWILTPVSVRGETWGRLVLILDDGPTPVRTMVLERAAVALTLNRLMEQSRETLERQAHRSTLSDILEQRYPSVREMHARTAALGIPTARRTLVAVIVDIHPRATAGQDLSTAAHHRADQNAELVGSAIRAAGVRALVGALHENRVGVLVPLRSARERVSTLRAIASRVREVMEARKIAADETEERSVIIGVGSPVANLDDMRRSFAEAGHVADAARGTTEVKPYYELPDIQLRGLLYILTDDPRVQAFVERALGPLLEYDSRHETGLVATLRVFLASGRNKSVAADRAHLSRQALYQRLATIERVLGVDLDSAEACTSLHAALMALQSLRSRTP